MSTTFPIDRGILSGRKILSGQVDFEAARAKLCVKSSMAKIVGSIICGAIPCLISHRPESHRPESHNILKVFSGQFLQFFIIVRHRNIKSITASIGEQNSFILLRA
jgi:hypothetical protein